MFNSSNKPKELFFLFGLIPPFLVLISLLFLKSIGQYGNVWLTWCILFIFYLYSFFLTKKIFPGLAYNLISFFIVGFTGPFVGRLIWDFWGSPLYLFFSSLMIWTVFNLPPLALAILISSIVFGVKKTKPEEEKPDLPKKFFQPKASTIFILILLVFGFWTTLSLVYLLLFVPAVVFLSTILKKHILKPSPIFLIPLISFIVLQFIPLPRSPLKYIGFMHENVEPWAIGIGFPFPIVKLYLGEGCLIGSLPCNNAAGTTVQERFRNGHFGPVGQDLSIKSGDIMFVYKDAGVGAILWGPLFIIAYLFSVKVLRKSRV